MDKIRAILKLTRIEHSLMLIVAILAAELIAKGLPDRTILLLSVITPVFISMAAFAINDYFDINVDRLNKKNRPLVIGELKPKDAIYVTIASLAIGIAASYFINYNCFIIALAFGILAMLYSYKLKGIALIGNAYVAFSMAIPFIFGNYVVSNNLGNSIILVSVMIFLSGLGREIHGTVRDMEGDMKARNLKTLPILAGKALSSVLAFIFYLIAILISIYLILYVAPFSQNLIFILLILLADVLLLYISLGYLFKKEGIEQFYGLARNISLAAMALSLFALLIAPI